MKPQLRVGAPACPAPLSAGYGAVLWEALRMARGTTKDEFVKEFPF